MKTHRALKKNVNINKNPKSIKKMFYQVYFAFTSEVN